MFGFGFVLVLVFVFGAGIGVVGNIGAVLVVGVAEELGEGSGIDLI